MGRKQNLQKAANGHHFQLAFQSLHVGSESSLTSLLSHGADHFWFELSVRGNRRAKTPSGELGGAVFVATDPALLRQQTDRLTTDALTQQQQQREVALPFTVAADQCVASVFADLSLDTKAQKRNKNNKVSTRT